MYSNEKDWSASKNLQPCELSESKRTQEGINSCLYTASIYIESNNHFRLELKLSSMYVTTYATFTYKNLVWLMKLNPIT